MDRRRTIFLAAVLIGIAVCVVSVQAVCDKGCECLTPAEAKNLGYQYCGDKPQVCTDALSKTVTVKYCYEKPVTPAPVPVKCGEGCSCMDPAKATASGYEYCDTPHAVCGYDAGQNPLYCFRKPEPVTATPVKCADGCTCMPPEKAKAAGYTSCGGEQVACNKDSAGNPLYCFGKPETAVEEQTITQIAKAVPVSCPKGCSCLDAAMVNKTGYRYCGGTRTLCDYDAAKNPMYCFENLLTPVPQTCSPGCSCLAPDKAKAAGYTYCDGKQTLCGYDSAKNSLYCYQKTSTKAVGEVSTTPMIVAVEKVTVIPAERIVEKVTTPGGVFPDILGMLFGGGCPKGATRCGDVCVDLQFSESHCGACNSPCGSGEVCEDGVCRLAVAAAGAQMMARPCPEGWINCDDRCFNPNVDESHCGDCGTACPDGYTCQAGTCCDPDGCPAPTAWCDGDCVDILRFESHCGACDTRCESSQYCINGVCGVIGQGGSDCRSDWLVCGVDCVNPQTNSENCGACGTVCPPGRECSGGSCVCAAGTTECARNPLGGLTPRKGWNTFCTNTQNDEDNCGVCGNACSSTKVCRNGQCTCREGEVYCDSCPEGEPSCDVPCVDFTFDPDHCGNCNRRCQDPTPDCCYGQCTNLLTDVNNCGHCSLPGRLSSACAPGFTCCNGRCVNTVTDRRNCHECGNDCGEDGVCCNGHCTYPSFYPGWDMCRVCGLNCELINENCCDDHCVDLLNDENNCGACGNACHNFPYSDRHMICCNGACTDLQWGYRELVEGGYTSDDASCGTCGHTCPFMDFCNHNGQCCFLGIDSLCSGEQQRQLD